MNIKDFVSTNRNDWKRLEKLLDVCEHRGFRRLGHTNINEFLALYRKTSADLNYARTFFPTEGLVEHLNSLVGRAYGLMYSKQGPRLWPTVRKFFAHDVPALVRKHVMLFLISALVLFGGVLFGALAVSLDPDSQRYLIPPGHMSQTPTERVQDIQDNGGYGGVTSGSSATVFSVALFTHNIRVSLLYFAFGFTFGIGTVIFIFYNGVILGALMARYFAFGQGLFFFAWILPHGLPELTSLLLSATGGLLLAKAILFPGERPIRDALRENGKDAVLLLLADAVFLVPTGFIEGTISQLHPPLLPYTLKLVFALIVYSFFLYYLFFRKGRARKVQGSLRRHRAQIA
ncbi:MAG: stage II sporulation protein M [Planctomycetota bacterium]|nr:stage II sporulation protein M [Planctomycetota bacterium]